MRFGHFCRSRMRRRVCESIDRTRLVGLSRLGKAGKIHRNRHIRLGVGSLKMFNFKIKDVFSPSLKLIYYTIKCSCHSMTSSRLKSVLSNNIWISFSVSFGFLFERWLPMTKQNSDLGENKNYWKIKVCFFVFFLKLISRYLEYLKKTV